MKTWLPTWWYIAIIMSSGKHAKPEGLPMTGINAATKEQHVNLTMKLTTFATYLDDSQNVENISLIPVTKIPRSYSKNVTEKMFHVPLVHNNDQLGVSRNKSIRNTHVSSDGTNLHSSKHKQGSNRPQNQVAHAGVPRGLAVFPLPLANSDHELTFNVTWDSPIGPPVKSYSIEVHSMTQSTDCESNLCYEYNIPGNSSWKLVPEFPSPVAEGCSVRPGCSYRVRLIPHPWDGHTSANLDVELNECVEGVCSCAHARRLPTPTVSATTMFVKGDLFVNVTWSLPVPAEPLRLPPRLMKQCYLISIGKQMVSDVHPAPWFAHSISRKMAANGFVVVPESHRWLLVPVIERNKGGKNEGRDKNKSGERKNNTRSIMLDMKLLARVSLVDEFGCVGPPGNAVAYDPAEVSQTSLRNLVLCSILGGTVVLAVVLLLAVGTRVIKSILKAFHKPSTTHLQPLNFRPPWLPVRLQTSAATNKSLLDPDSTIAELCGVERRCILKNQY